MATLTLLFIITAIFPLFFQSVSSAVDCIEPFQSISDGTTLVSRDGSFELGFFSRGASKNRYVGIWYKNIPVQTIVWVANRCNPINDSSGLLTINNTGNLVLLYQNKSLVWSTNSLKQAKKPIVQLQDSGNLVLRDGEDVNSETNYLWQSFDYPSDTLLPEMKLGWDLRTGLNRRVTAWKSWDDPCPGNFTAAIEFDRHRGTFPEMYFLNGRTKYYRTGPWNGLRFSGTLERPNPLYNYEFVYNDDEVYYTFSLKNKSLITIAVMNQTTNIRERLTWIEEEQSWMIYSSTPKDDCDKYDVCGANANCMINNNPICQCLKGFQPKSLEKWNSMDWSAGCAQTNTRSCKDKAKDVFVRFTGLKLPDASRSWVAGNLNLEDCRSICLNNCSCTAYANSDNRGNGSGCVTWYGDLINIRTVPNNEEHIFIRMSHSDLEGKDRHTVTRIIIAAPVIGGVSLMLILGYCICSRVLKGRKSEATRKNGAKVDEFELPLYSLAAISTATDNFSVNNKIGEGGFGSVYRGRLEDGQEIAVKRLSVSSHQGINEFKNEVILIAKLQHRNLVKLLGCCIEREENLLIYEYMPNKSLDILIFDQQQKKLIKWQKRFEIISGIARGLQYLHQDSRLRIVHRDLKASNILLDDMMNPKISDFGIAKSFGGDQIEGSTNRIAGTYGYMAPEYAFNGLFSTKSDVFSFGIMVLEIVSGKRSIRFHEKIHNLTLIGHAWTLLNQGCPLELIDARLRDSYDNLQQVMRCIHVGLLCVQQHPGDRPNMSSVVLMLSGEGDLPPPKPPGYFTETDSHETDCMSTKPESPSKITMTVTAFGGR